MADRPKAVVGWSSGKDSAYALHVERLSAEVEIVGLLTTLSDEFDRVSMHGVRNALLDQQLTSLDMPCTKIRIPSPCPNEEYERHMGAALETLRAEGVTEVVFGDLFLQDIRTYRETQLARIGMTARFPLWHRNSRELAQEMIGAGLRAVLTCVDPRVLDPSFAGRPYDLELLDDLPAGVDPCGENGEFHTVVLDGPMFRQPVAAERGEIVVRDGFVFADVLQTSE